MARDGSGKIVEVYPAAALHVWGFPSQGYKGPKHREARVKLVTLIEGQRNPRLQLHGVRGACDDSDDVLDALVAALVARAGALDTSKPIQPDQRDRAAREGWIQLAKPHGLPASPS